MGIKLNVGASPIWDKEGWHILDHKLAKNAGSSIAGDASSISLPDQACETIFCSHMFEHIPHTKLESVILEFNRTLCMDGIVRVLVPDLKKIATAYVNEDRDFFIRAKEEDESIRTDLGLGGMLVNFVVSPGQDTALMNRGLDKFIAGYAHVYAYDFDMLRILFERIGFGEVRQMGFCESRHSDYREPLHVQGFAPEWETLNQGFYKKHGLVHRYDSKAGRYDINFRVTGFDRDPLLSLIVEARKNKHVEASSYQSLNDSLENYNRYAFSLLKDPKFAARLETVVASAKTGG